MLKTFAVSILYESRGGSLQHNLHIIEANSLDAAEATVMSCVLEAGGFIMGLMSQSCALSDTALSVLRSA